MAYFLLVLTVLFWAGNFVLARSLVDLLPPVSMASMRWSLAFILLLPFVYPRLWRDRKLLVKHWKIITLLSLFGVAAFNTTVYLGVQHTTATNATLLQSSIPILVLILSVIFFSEKISIKQLLGVCFSFVGVLVIIAKGQLDMLLAFSLNTGDLWILIAVSCWTIYSVLLRYKPAQLDGLSFLGASIFIGNLILYPLVYWELQYVDINSFQVTWQISSAVMYLAIFPSLLAYFFWNRAVAEVGAARASLFIHLLPVFGALLATLLLGEAMQIFHLIGIILIFIGIYLAIITDILRRSKLRNL
ncbi:MAG: DMT family transporter [Pseudomonadales bacterium]|nr:DMT family transporter [Pseudomonadales bacterium]NRA14351.1 DMT family transporter [Oceanospirillaceae bacterium]